MLRARIAVTAATRDPDEALLVVEADAAVRGFPALADVLAKRVSPRVRAEALCTVARSRFKEGAHADAAALFERALDLLEPAARRARWRASFARRGTRPGEAPRPRPASRRRRPPRGLLRPFAPTAGWKSPSDARPAAIRQRRRARARRGLQARSGAARPLERARARRRDRGRRRRARGGDGSDRGASRRPRASGGVQAPRSGARAKRQTSPPTEHAWLRGLALDPHDEEADHALESIVVGRGRFDELADHLKRRAERLGAQSEKREVLRAVRLRLAAILEQRLGRVEEACEELGVLARRVAGQPGRAALPGRPVRSMQGEVARSAPLWSRAASRVEMDAAGRAELELKAARAFLAAGDVAGAQEHASRTTTRHPPGPDCSRFASTSRAPPARIASSERRSRRWRAPGGSMASASATSSSRLPRRRLASATPPLALDRSRRAAEDHPRARDPPAPRSRPRVPPSRPGHARRSSSGPSSTSGASTRAARRARRRAARVPPRGGARRGPGPGRGPPGARARGRRWATIRSSGWASPSGTGRPGCRAGGRRRLQLRPFRISARSPQRGRSRSRRRGGRDPRPPVPGRRALSRPRRRRRREPCGCAGRAREAHRARDGGGPACAEPSSGPSAARRRRTGRPDARRARGRGAQRRGHPSRERAPAWRSGRSASSAATSAAPSRSCGRPSPTG